MWSVGERSRSTQKRPSVPTARQCRVQQAEKVGLRAYTASWLRKNERKKKYALRTRDSVPLRTSPVGFTGGPLFGAGYSVQYLLRLTFQAQAGTRSPLAEIFCDLHVRSDPWIFPPWLYSSPTSKLVRSEGPVDQSISASQIIVERPVRSRVKSQATKPRNSHAKMARSHHFRPPTSPDDRSHLSPARCGMVGMLQLRLDPRRPRYLQLDGPEGALEAI